MNILQVISLFLLAAHLGHYDRSDINVNLINASNHSFSRRSCTNGHS